MEPVAKAQAIEPWMDEHHALVREKTIPKAIEYGSGDLHEIGNTIGRLTANLDERIISAEELGVYFYLVGKIARVTSALEAGRRPSDDTYFDIEVYALMLQKIRQTGSWS